MYCIFLYVYHKHQPNVGKSTSPMDGMGKTNSQFDMIYKFVKKITQQIHPSVGEKHRVSRQFPYLPRDPTMTRMGQLCAWDRLRKKKYQSEVHGCFWFPSKVVGSI